MEKPAPPKASVFDIWILGFSLLQVKRLLYVQIKMIILGTYFWPTDIIGHLYRRVGMTFLLAH